MSLNDLVLDQGEIVVSLLETKNGELVVTGYGVRERRFSGEELRDTYLQAFSMAGRCEEKEEKMLSAYFSGQTTSIPKDLESFLVQQGSLGSEAGVGETAQVFSKKYKPVIRKVKPVLGTSPEEFRIERCITGDPLAEMPQLNPHPPDFKPTGRYIAEYKDIIDQVHGEGFL